MSEIQRPHVGNITVITGPMFAGKTSALFSHLRRHMIAKDDPVLFKTHTDIRYSKTEVATHDKQVLPATVVPSDRSSYDIILEMSKGKRVICFDEVQFFLKEVNMPKLVEQLANQGKLLYMTLLNRDFKGEPFENASGLLELADTVESLKAICTKCNTHPPTATFSQRIDDKGNPSWSGELIEVGDAYAARCRSCFVWPPGTAQQLANCTD